MNSIEEDIEKKVDLQDDDILEFIFKSNKDINSICIRNTPLIFWLIEKDKLDLIKKLYSGFYGNERLNINITSKKNDFTPLHRACDFNRFNIVKFLLDEGVDPNIKDHAESPPLFFCYGIEDMDIISLLLDRGAKIEPPTKPGVTFLHHSVLSENLKLASFLLNRGADINAKTKEGETALHYACQRYNLDMVKFFLENGAKVDYINGMNTCLSKKNLEKKTDEEIEELSKIFFYYKTRGIKGISREEK
jgi:ankyrin repeat protein